MRVLLTMACLTLAGAAQAQVEQHAKWAVFRGETDDPGVAAGMCPLYDEAKGQAFCLALSCEPGDVMDFVLSVTGFPLAETMTTAVEVDGRAVGELKFARTETPGGFEYLAAFDRQAHPELVNRLRRGANATFILSGEAELFRQTMVLVDSSKSLGVVLTECKVPTGD